MKMAKIKKTPMVLATIGALLIGLGAYLFKLPRDTFWGGNYQDIFVLGMGFFITGIVWLLWKKINQKNEKENKTYLRFKKRIKSKRWTRWSKFPDYAKA